MKKNFFQLLYRLKELGCNVIYANFHKIIIHTERTTFDEAENFMNFVIHTIKQKPLFAFLSLTPTDYWRVLLFKDIYNYGGIRESGGGGDTSSNKKVVAKWDIAQHLPESIQRKFLVTVSEYILKVYRYNQKMVSSGQQMIQQEEEAEGGPKNAAGENKGQVDKITSYMDTVDDAKKGRDHGYIVKLISEYFSQKLFSLIHEIFVRKEDKDQEAQDFAEDLEDQEYLAALNIEGEANGDQAGDEIENVVENKYARWRKQKERERKIAELKKWDFPQKIGSYNEYT